MRRFLLPSVAIAAILVSSCVSNSTYEEAIGRIDSLSTSNDSLERVIYANNADIADLNSQAQINARRIAVLQNELSEMKRVYEAIKNSSNQATQNLMADIERLQKEKVSLQTETDRINMLLKSRDDKINSLMAKLKQSLLGFENSGLTLDIKNGRVYVSLSNQLLFPSGSIQINSEGEKALANLSEVLKQQTDINTLIEGHTDDKAVRGGYRFTDNWELSVLRATEVAKYIVEKGGVSPEKVIASGRSQYLPLDTEDSDQARAMNRRTEIILTPDLGEIYDILKK